MPYIFPFVKYSMKFIKLGSCRYCFQTDAVSMHGTCIVCKQLFKRAKDQRKSARRKLDPVRLAAFQERENRRKREWLVRIKTEDPEKYRNYYDKNKLRKRLCRRRNILARNKQRLTAIKQELDDGTI